MGGSSKNEFLVDWIPHQVRNDGIVGAVMNRILRV